jgi:hypothetical protein
VLPKWHVLREQLAAYRWKSHADCLTGNRYHAVIVTQDGNVSMHQLSGVFILVGAPD